MGFFRFRRRKQLVPGVSVNLSKSGFSLSLGQKGARHTVGHGKSRTTVGIPGTGLSYSVQHGKSHSQRHRSGGEHYTDYAEAAQGIETSSNWMRACQSSFAAGEEEQGRREAEQVRAALLETRTALEVVGAPPKMAVGHRMLIDAVSGRITAASQLVQGLERDDESLLGPAVEQWNRNEFALDAALNKLTRDARKVR